MKTRLAASLGEVAAAAAYEELAAWSLQNLVGVREGVKCWIAYTPAEARVAVAEWLRGNVPALQWDRLLPQAEGDLGDRLWDAVETALVKEGAASVTLIGTDCPRLRADHFMQAQRWLEEGADVVFGPAKDGGYYLQALKSAAREMFTDIPWSQPAN